MSIVFGHTTAIEILQMAALPQCRLLRLSDFSMSRKSLLPQTAATSRAWEFAARCSLSLPLHVYVANQKSRRNVQGLKCHVWSHPLPHGSLLRIADDIYVSSPEFVFLQVAGNSTRMGLIEAGYELCGFHATHCHFDEELLQMPKPLTNKTRLAAYLARTKGLYGAGMARWAQRYVAERTRSPRETKLHMSLSLPRHYGGQAADFLELNVEIPLGKKLQKVAGKAKYEIDVYDREGKTGFEYNSRLYHSGEMRSIEDIRRESVLRNKGISVHVVTKSQSENALEIVRLAKIAYKARGRRFRPLSPDHIMKTQRLLNELYRVPGFGLYI